MERTENSTQENALSAGIPTRPLGKTGVNVSIIGVGGGHIGSIQNENESINLMHASIDAGITFFDHYCPK
jgi:aryl-alcohol dehydrogenase-like predicted oxidoreductase